MQLNFLPYKPQENKIINKIETLLNISYYFSSTVFLGNIQILNPDLENQRQTHAYLKAISDLKQSIKKYGIPATLANFKKRLENHSQTHFCLSCINYDYRYGYWLGVKDTFLLIEVQPLVELYNKYPA